MIPRRDPRQHGFLRPAVAVAACGFVLVAAAGGMEPRAGGTGAGVAGTDIQPCAGMPGGSDDEPACRLYAAKMLGTTFANLKTTPVHGAHVAVPAPPAWDRPTSNNAALFSAALAGGLWIPRDSGAIRLECEAALRDNFDQALNPANQTAIGIRANDNWTVLGNAWRDIPLTERLTAYAGGGVGGGGFRLDAIGPAGTFAANQFPVFAWQAGGGGAWRYNDLVDVAVSYRFLDYGRIDAPLTAHGGASAGTVSAKMTGGEMFFVLRVRDPFQWHRHLLDPASYLPQ